MKFGKSVHTDIYYERIYLLVPRPLNFADVRIFAKKTFFNKNSAFIQGKSMRAVLDIFRSVFSFVRQKVANNQNVGIIDHASGVRVPDCSKSTINQKNDDDVVIC